MSTLGPLILDPILVPKPWGGNWLEALGKKPASDHPVGTVYGESWEVADLAGETLTISERGRTPVATGTHRGKTLRRLISELGTALLGSASPTPAGDFPLLFKLLDTAEHLSIQVHPDETHAAANPEWRSKTESWYVLGAEPGATIFKGLRSGVGMDDVRAAAGNPALVGLMQRIRVRRGEFHHLPAGTVHALGAGVTVAEVQTPSDTTFRLYDWTDEYDRPPRRLQVEHGLEALALDPPAAVSHPPMEGEGTRLLVHTPHYWLREHRTKRQTMTLRNVPELRILALVDGHAAIESPEHPPLEMRAGLTAVIPAAAATSIRVTPLGTVTLLEMGLP